MKEQNETIIYWNENLKKIKEKNTFISLSMKKYQY